MFLARKITHAKWKRQDLLPHLTPDEISADAVTADLRTREDSLSLWRCGVATERDIEEVALALAASSEQPSKIDIVWLDEDDLLQDGHTLQLTEGRTPVRDLRNHHIDLCGLDYKRLGQVAYRILDAIRNEQYRTVSRRTAISILSDAISQNRLDIYDLKEKVRRDLE